MASLLAALATIGTILKEARAIIDWMKDEHNKRLVLEINSSWQALKAAKTHEERQNAASAIASVISR